MRQLNPSVYERLKQRYRELIGGKCQNCGREYFPPPARCRSCGSYKIADSPMPRKGRLITYTVLKVTANEFKGMEPIVIGMVQLDNGVKLLSQIEIKEAEKLIPGARLKMDLLKMNGSFEVFKFKIDTDANE